MKFIILAIVIVLGAIFMTIAEKAMKIDFSRTSSIKRLTFQTMYALYGGAIIAVALIF